MPFLSLRRISFTSRHLAVTLGVVCAVIAQNASSSPDSREKAVGSSLQGYYIWTAEPISTPGFLHAGFRKSFDLANPPASAKIHLFAYTRYQLFINGEYVGRGPNRFESLHPEFDTWDVAKQLRPGRNAIAVLVQRDWTGENPKSTSQTLSRMRLHAPGFTARLEIQDDKGTETIIQTDTSWRAFREPTRLSPIGRYYASIPDHIDAGQSPADWTTAVDDDSKLPLAVKLDTSDLKTWPEPNPRSIPLLRETEIPFTLEPASQDGVILLTPGTEFIARCQRISQAYWVLDLDAEADSKLIVTPLLPENNKGTPSIYTCRAGKQRWIGGDTFAFNALSIRLESGRASVRVARLVEVLYPFERVGSFSSNDPNLNRIWQLAARSLEVLSEDAYTDCGDRERSEWMDCDPPMYDATRVMMTGPAENGGRVWSDPRLFANMLRRVAYTQDPDGMLKARTCSELTDIHTRMEDRACDWVDGLRKYYEASGDKDLIRELWPYCERLLQWFESRHTERGLVRAREWIAWDNPMAYATCEGAANNAFIQRAFSDAAWLSQEIGNATAAAKWHKAADQLKSDFNQRLWNETAGAYGAAIGPLEVLPNDRMFKKSINLKSINGLTEPTLHANLFAMDRGLVPPERRARVVSWILAHESQIRQIMANHFYFKLLYSLDEPRYDQIVLNRIRDGWKKMIDSPWQTTWEGTTGGGSKMHCYGIVPAYTLSTYVLGVRRTDPVLEEKLLIEPHLGDLTEASGTVVTEFGPVAVSWKKAGAQWQFEIETPEPVATTLALPIPTGQHAVLLDGSDQHGTRQGTRMVFELSPGKHHGSFPSAPSEN